jgi:hypothetical protein
MAEKKKILNPPPIEIDVVDIDGNEHLWKARTVTSANMQEMFEAIAKADTSKQTLAQCMWLFGGEEKDYENFDIRTLRAACKYFNEELIRPI